MLENKKVSEIIKLIQTKQISVKEVVEFYLARIEKYNPKLNAIILLRETEKILEEAKKKDNQQNKNKSLFGLPLAVKDLSDVVGIQTTYGFKGYKDYFPKKNSFFVDKLIENGAIIIGKTNTAELGVGGHTINRLFGPTSNVYDLSKSSGGSSGGASSAVAAQLIPFADGTDQMGSCRNPAAYSNIYGFRPTPGVIASARSDNQKNIPILTTPGFLSRTPDDMTIILDSVTGKHSLDPYSLELKSNFQNFEIKDSEIKNIKIAWLSDINGKYKFENEILEICEKKLSELNNQNIKIDYLKSGINTDELDILTGIVFSSSAELVRAVKAVVPLSSQQSLKVIEYSLKNSLVINAEKLSSIDDHFLSTQQLDSLGKLEGEKYNFSWQLGDALAQKDKEWKLQGGGLKNKLKDREIKSKLAYLYRLFKEKEK